MLWDQLGKPSKRQTSFAPFILDVSGNVSEDAEDNTSGKGKGKQLELYLTTFCSSDHYLTSGKERAQTSLFDQGDSTEPESEGEIQVLAKKDAQKLRKRTCPALTSQWL